MNGRIGFCIKSGLLCAGLALSLAATAVAASSAANDEQKFEMLQIGATTYRNVTVTTKSKSYVFLMHSQGMTSVKVQELPADVLEKLGYENPNIPKVQTNGPAVWAKETIAKLDSSQVKEVQEEIKSKWNSTPAGARLPMPEVTKTLLLEIAGVLLLFYLFHCFCCMLICKKAGSNPGILVWIPVLQLFPLLRAAGMSGWWFFGYLVPVLNIVVQVLWCFKIADARGKTAFVGLLLLFPVTSPLAFLYLAFSNGVKPSKPIIRPRQVEMMTLETA